MNNFKSDKFVEVLQEFLIVQGQNTYSIGSMSLSDVYFFVKKGNENYKVLATGQYQVVGTNLIINDASVITNNTNIQVCKVLNIVASKYISDIANINTLRDHYNTLVDDFIKIIDFLRKSGIKSDSSSMNYIFPLLEEGQVFMKKGLGFEGKQVMDIDAELQAQIDKAYAFFEQYVNNEKKPELDAYTVSKKQELETYTIAKKGEINTLVAGHKTDINTLADTKKTEIIELGNLKQQEIISLSTGKIKEITDVTTVKKQEIETLTAQKKVQITDHTNLEIQKILSLGIDGLQAQINVNKSDILSKVSNSRVASKDWSVLPIPCVSQDGVVEVGKHFDFHENTQDKEDYSVRLTALNGRLYITESGGDKYAGNILGEISKAETGWCKFPNGLIVQWGLSWIPKTQGGHTINFPITFTIMASGSFIRNYSYGSPSGVMTTGEFRINNLGLWQEIVDGDGQPNQRNQYFWIAIGY